MVRSILADPALVPSAAAARTGSVATTEFGLSIGR